MKITKFIILLIVFTYLIFILVGCSTIKGYLPIDKTTEQQTSDISKEQNTSDDTVKKESTSTPRYVKYRSYNQTYSDYQEEQKKQLWDNSGIKRPKKENEYIQMPHDVFICTTQEDMNHALDMIMATKGRYTSQYIDMYTRLVSGTSCIIHTYPATALGYVTGVGTYKNIKEVKVMWKQEGLPFHQVNEGWVCQTLDPTMVDYDSLKYKSQNTSITI